MKYAMVVMRDREAFRPSEQPGFETTAEWWAELRAKVVATTRLAPDDRVVSITSDGAAPLVTDGPYPEAKESVGGILIVDVDSMEEAVALARTTPLPVGLRIEIRPVLDP